MRKFTRVCISLEGSCVLDDEEDAVEPAGIHSGCCFPHSRARESMSHLLLESRMADSKLVANMDSLILRQKTIVVNAPVDKCRR